MPAERETNSNEKGDMLYMKEEKIMLKLSDILLKEQFISFDEKEKLTKMIQNRRS